MTPRRVAYVLDVFPALSEPFIAGEIVELIRKDVNVRILSLRRPDRVSDAFASDPALTPLVAYGPDRFDAIGREFRPELVHTHSTSEAAAIAQECARMYGIPFTITAHSGDLRPRSPADFANRAVAAAAVITTSHANALQVAAIFGVPRSRVHVIGHGVDIDWFRPRGRIIESSTVVCVAPLRSDERLSLLLEACARVRQRGVEFRCTIVGEGPQRPELEQSRRQLNLDGVVALPGVATQAQIRVRWRAAAVAALTSDDDRRIVSVMEAAACGVPAAAAAGAAVSEVVEHGVSGFVVPSDDGASLAAALEELLRNSALRCEMSRAARRRAEACFARSRQVGRLRDLWSTLLSERHHGAFA
jgi:colanic acid/amylovoran biosynthesis glycosyltransferase